MGIIECHQPNIPVAIDLTAFPQFHHQCCSVRIVEHRMRPHVPIGIAGVRIVRKFETDRPAIVDAILYLPGNLIVREIGQE